MDTWRRRTVYYLVGLVAVMLVYVGLYHHVMATYEDDPVTVLHAAQVVVETFTTTGFGSDSPWTTPESNLLIIAMDLTGVVLIFLALPVLLFPLFEETISTTPPRAVDGVEDHVVVCAFSPRIRALLDELDVLDIPYVVVESDRDEAVELVEEDLPVVHGDPESGATLENAGVDAARAVVADVDDETNASIALTSKGVSPETDVITFVQTPEIETYHRYAGADHVYSPRQLIGQSIASKVSRSVSAEIGDAVEIGEDFEIVEFPVQADSDIAGTRMTESRIRERTGANVIGAWFRGEFVSPPSPDALIDEQTVLLVAGQERQLEQLKELTLSERQEFRTGRIIIGGYGEVGSTVATALAENDIPTVTVDRDGEKDVDVVGDLTDEATLEAAGIDDASTVILALPDDTTTIFATLVLRELAPEVEIVARANGSESVRKIYQAGADYVLALSTVSGRMLASTILGEDVISFDQQVEIVRFGADQLAGDTPAGEDIRARTGATIIAVERNGDVITDFGPDFEFAADDDLIVAGPDNSITQFAATYT
ncbi:potassium channel family protein [Halorientalis marina]|uniref:potassium channel family protein n=1 Tax=Halorientalis marina TaxID=2931976 RepID=UPI001FF5BA59|nr:NAD-binding protein [Halorientalis marina]